MSRKTISKQKPKTPFSRTVRTIFGIMVALGGMSASFVLAYFVMRYLYRVFDYHPQGLWAQLLTFGEAFLNMGLVGFIVSRFAAASQIAFWQSIISAIKQMSQGNFNVNVEIQSSRMGQDDRVQELVSSINHMAEELGQVERMRQEFISNVSHEIQSPLTSIAGFVHALKDDNLSADKRLHYLHIIETESQRLSKLSDNLMKLTTLESNQQSLRPHKFRLDTQLRNVVLSMEPLWMKKDIVLDLQLENISIIAVEDLLSQVWQNLINNAIKFTPPRGKIHIGLQHSDDDVRIFISDNGVGISEEDQERIFERFYKSDKSRDRTKEGNGLGLAIVKKILDMHHGTIRVQSHLNEGTTFTIQMPLAYEEVDA